MHQRTGEASALGLPRAPVEVQRRGVDTTPASVRRCMRSIALVVLLSLTLTAAFVPAAEAASVDESAQAPQCTGYIGVRCADGGTMCIVYVRRTMCLHL